MPSFGPGSLFADLASVTINFATTSVGRAEFGTALIVADDFPVSTRTATYSNSQEVEAALAASEISSALSTKLKAMLGQRTSPSKVKIGKRVSASETYAQAVTAIIEDDADFYAFVVDSRVDADIIGYIAAVQAEESNGNFYLCFGQSSNADWLTSGKPTGYGSEERGIVVYHDTNTEPAVEAWTAKVLAFDADLTSAQWIYQDLLSVAEYATTLTATQSGLLDSNNANRIANLGAPNPAVVFKGINLNGRPVDHVLTADLIRFRTSERIAELVLSLANKGIKLTVDVVGQGAIEAELQGLGEVLETAGHIQAGEWVIGAQDITDADRTAQRLRFVNEAALTNPLVQAVFTYNLSTSPIAGGV